MVTHSGQRPLQPWLSVWPGGAGLDTTWACTTHSLQVSKRLWGQ